jgi:hypothetical protein
VIDVNRRGINQVMTWALFAGILLLGFPPTAQRHPPALSGNLPIAAPQAIHAGETMQVIIGPVAQAQNGTPVGLVIVGAYGPHVYQSVFQAGQDHFHIPSDATLQSGYLALIAAAEEARGGASVRLVTQSQVMIVSDLIPTVPIF